VSSWKTDEWPELSAVRPLLAAAKSSYALCVHTVHLLDAPVVDIQRAAHAREIERERCSWPGQGRRPGAHLESKPENGARDAHRRGAPDDAPVACCARCSWFARRKICAAGRALCRLCAKPARLSPALPPEDWTGRSDCDYRTRHLRPRAWSFRSTSRPRRMLRASAIRFSVPPLGERLPDIGL
jgi:hypothetical protein